MSLAKGTHGQYHAAARILQRQHLIGHEMLNVDQPLVGHPPSAGQHDAAQHGGDKEANEHRADTYGFFHQGYSLCQRLQTE